jgi:hypothetical protein
MEPWRLGDDIHREEKPAVVEHQVELFLAMTHEVRTRFPDAGSDLKFATT